MQPDYATEPSRRSSPITRACANCWGRPARGNSPKCVNQICHCRPWCRASPRPYNFGMKAGLDMEAVIDVISKGAAGSWQMENRHKTMIAGNEFNFGFAVDWMRKDLGICHRPRRSNNGVHTCPITALVDQFYGRGPVHGRQSLGYVELDRTSSKMIPSGGRRLDCFSMRRPWSRRRCWSALLERRGLPVVGMLGVPVLSLATSPVRCRRLCCCRSIVVTDMSSAYGPIGGSLIAAIWRSSSRQRQFGVGIGWATASLSSLSDW